MRNRSLSKIIVPRHTDGGRLVLELALVIVAQSKNVHLVESFQSVLWYLAKNMGKRGLQFLPRPQDIIGFELDDMQRLDVCEARV